MTDMIITYWPQILQIILIDLLLSGDNAIIIALACRQLPPEQRRIGMVLGAGTAIGLRILFALIVAYLLRVPFLKIVGGLLLLWIAVKLALGEDESHEVEASESLWRAVRTIAIADAVMSLDNVVAIVGASHGNNWLFIFGILLSLPLIVVGSAVLTTLIVRFPIIVWAGAALLGWIAGHMIVDDYFVVTRLQEAGSTLVNSGATPGDVPVAAPALWQPAAVLGAVFVVALAWLLKRRRQPGGAVAH